MPAKYPGPGVIHARANPAKPLCFTEDCPHCGYAFVYSPVEFASGEVACIWCADSEQRPACWRFTSDRWMLYRIYMVDRYPTLNLEVSR